MREENKLEKKMAMKLKGPQNYSSNERVKPYICTHFRTQTHFQLLFSNSSLSCFLMEMLQSTFSGG